MSSWSSFCCPVVANVAASSAYGFRSTSVCVCSALAHSVPSVSGSDVDVPRHFECGRARLHKRTTFEEVHVVRNMRTASPLATHSRSPQRANACTFFDWPDDSKRCGDVRTIKQFVNTRIRTECQRQRLHLCHHLLEDRKRLEL